MLEYIKKLQQKDEDARKRIMMFSMVIVVVIVGSIWLYSLSGVFGKSDEITKEEVRDDLKPFTLFKNSMKDTYNNVSASVGKISLPKLNKDLNLEESEQIDLIVVDKVTE